MSPLLFIVSFNCVLLCIVVFACYAMVNQGIKQNKVLDNKSVCKYCNKYTYEENDDVGDLE